MRGYFRFSSLSLTPKPSSLETQCPQNLIAGVFYAEGAALQRRCSRVQLRGAGRNVRRSVHARGGTCAVETSAARSFTGSRGGDSGCDFRRGSEPPRQQSARWRDGTGVVAGSATVELIARRMTILAHG